MNLDFTSIITIVGIAIGVILILSGIIYVIIVIRRKTKVKEVTILGTDKSDFAKQLMDKYHEERRNQE